jgi:hypothetical protein
MMEKQNNVMIIAMFRKPSWYWSVSNMMEKQNNIMIIATFRKPSWYLGTLQCVKYNGKHTIISSYLQCSRGVHGIKVPPAAQIRNKTQQYHYICNVPQVCMVPPEPPIQFLKSGPWLPRATHGYPRLSAGYPRDTAQSTPTSWRLTGTLEAIRLPHTRMP